MLKESDGIDKFSPLELLMDDVQWLRASWIGFPGDCDRISADDDLDPAAEFGVLSFDARLTSALNSSVPGVRACGGSNDLSKS